MDSVDLEVIRSAARWVEAGRGATLVTVVKTWGSSPRPVGAMLALRDDGHVVGSVSGGCVEEDLIDKVRAGELVSGGKPGTITYGVTQEQAERFRLPCGGTLELALEPLAKASGIAELLAMVERHELAVRYLDMATGATRLAPGSGSDRLEFDGKVLKTAHGPRWRLLAIGAAQLSRYLALFAQALDYQVTVCDPREEFADEWDVPGVAVNRGYPDDVVQQLNLDGRCAVVALTHDPKLDDAALIEALKSPAFYVGALGSQRNNDARRKRLAGFDLSADEIARLHGPVGLALGGKTPPEIALAILAEMTAVRHGVGVPELVAPPKAPRSRVAAG